MTTTETDRDAAAKTSVLLVTGLSGAGKSSALRYLEDLGWEVVDNLPLYLLSGLINDTGEAAAPRPQAVAIGIDSRTRGFGPATLAAEIGRLSARGGIDVSLLFFDCDGDVLQNRFTATRRRHPLAADRPVSDGIRQERSAMRAIQEIADRTIDTTALSLPELREIIAEAYSLAGDPGLYVSVCSFSYKRGLPREADLVFDARFLRNPFYEAKLRERTGLDDAVGAFIAADPAWAPFLEKLTDMLRTLLPRYLQEGKHYLTIAIGCTGGRHRSVHAAETVAGTLRADGFKVNVRHRDIDMAGGA